MLFRFLLNIFTIYILVNSISSCKGGNRHTEMKVKFRKGGESCSKGNNSSYHFT